MLAHCTVITAEERTKVDLTLAKADANEFDGVLLPDGVINGDALRIDKKAQQFVQEIDRAAVCRTIYPRSMKQSSTC